MSSWIRENDGDGSITAEQNGEYLDINLGGTEGIIYEIPSEYASYKTAKITYKASGGNAGVYIPKDRNGENKKLEANGSENTVTLDISTGIPSIKIFNLRNPYTLSLKSIVFYE